jgi:hypothetical protein
MTEQKDQGDSRLEVYKVSQFVRAGDCSTAHHSQSWLHKVFNKERVNSFAMTRNACFPIEGSTSAHTSPKCQNNNHTKIRIPFARTQKLPP